MSTEIFAIKIQQTGAEKVAKDVEKVGAASKRSQKHVEDLSASAKKSAGIMSQFRGALVALSAIRAAGSIVEIVDAAQRMSNQMKVSTGSTKEYNRAMEFLQKISLETRTDIDANATVYGRLLRSTQGLAFTTADLEKTMEGLTLAVKVGGATSMEARNSLIQFSQSLASGALRGDELRSVAEQLPALADAIGKEFGIAGGQLLAFAKANPGVLQTEKVIRGVMNGVEQLREKFKLMGPTLSEGFTVMRTQFIIFLTNVEKSSGLMTLLAYGLIAVANSLSTLIPLAIAFGAALGIGLLTSWIAQIYAANNLLIRYIATGRLLIATQTAINAVMMRNPLALFVVAIGAAVYALYKLYLNSVTLRGIINGLVNAFNLITTAIGQAWSVILEAIGGWDGFKVIMEATGKVVGFLILLFGTLFVGALAAFMLAANAVVQVMASLGIVNAETAKKTQEATDAALKATGGLLGLGKTTADTSDKTTAFNDVVEDLRTQMIEGMKSIGGNTEALNANGKAVDALAEKSARMVGHIEGFGQSMRSLSSELTTTAASMWDSTAAGQKLRDSLSGVSGEADVAADSIGGVNTGLQALLGIDGQVYNGLNGIASGYANVANAANAAASATRNAQSAVMGAKVTGGGGGGSSGPKSTPLGGFFSSPSGNKYSGGGGFTVVSARAKGGPVSAGQTYMVGENGPEMITPKQDGMVHTNKATQLLMKKLEYWRAEWGDFMQDIRGLGGIIAGPNINRMMNIQDQIQKYTDWVTRSQKIDAQQAAEKQAKMYKKEFKNGFQDDGKINMPGFENVGAAPKIDFQTLTPWQGGKDFGAHDPYGVGSGKTSSTASSGGGNSTVSNDNSIKVVLQVNGVTDAGSFRQNQAQIEGQLLASVERAQRRRMRR